jgi:outer membrane protein assembly factor BamB/tetratricopeptide (TPR) repeat protein
MTIPRLFHASLTRPASWTGARLLPLVAVLCFLAALSGSPILGQFGNRTGATKFYPDFSDEADNLLRNAANHARDSQWGEAIEIYQRVIQQFGDKVARMPKDVLGGDPKGDSLLYVDVRRFCQNKIAELPPEARAIYRSRVDPQAERWFRQGQATRDRTSLRRLISQAFCSSWGDDALELLGDLAFQDGEFEEALTDYRQLVPDSKADAATLIHPDPSIDLARVAAKKLLCRAAIGENVPSRTDLEAFKTAYPEAKGALAGRTQPYAQTIAEALSEDKLAPPLQPDGRWPTFAGSPTRTRVVPGPVDVGSLQWKVDLDRIEPGQALRGGIRRGTLVPIGQVAAERLLGYHPIVIRDQVIVANDSQVTAYNLNDRPEGPPGSTAGSIKLAWRHDEDQNGFVPQAARPTIGVPRFTLTAFGNRLYARMGQTALPYPGARGGGLAQNYLIALDLATDGKLLWKKLAGDVLTGRPAAEAGSKNLGFEGSPVADARRVYVAMTDRGVQTATYVVCLDADTGATHWVRYLGAAASDGDQGFGMGMGMGMGMGPAGFSGDYGHRLLSLNGSTIYFQTNLGAVVALDAEAGTIRWVATYPRQDRNSATGQRDLNPAIVHDGLVIVAPDDASSIYAFDAMSGRLHWKSDPVPDEVKLAHLLGVAKGKLVATGDRVLLFDVKTGKLEHTWPDNGRHEGFGRGLLAGDKIYWPTHNEIHVLDQGTGLRSEPPIKLLDTFQTTGGNLAVGDGYLIVAQSDRMVVFCQNRRLIQRFQEEIARTPDEAVPHFQMAKAAEATGQDELALASIELALAKARPSETFDGVPLEAAAVEQKFRLLMKMGDKARSSGALLVAESRFTEAASTASADRDRLRARLARAEVQLDRGSARDAVATLQGLLTDDRLRSISVVLEEGRRTIRSDLLIADRLTSILKTGDRSLYEPFDHEAKDLFERGKSAGDARQIEEVGRSYPVALVLPESLLTLARLYDGQKRPADAARTYKRLLNATTDDSLRARALLGEAQAFKDQKLFVSARDAYTEAMIRFPDVEIEVEEVGSLRRVGLIAARKLEEAPFDRMIADRAEPRVLLPLERVWEHRCDPSVRPISAEGLPPSPESSRIFLAVGNRIKPIVLSKHESPWEVELDSAPVWIGFLDDRVVVATERQLVALELSKGEKLWSFEGSPLVPGQTGPNPFLRADTGPRAGGEGTSKLQGFRVVGDRVFCLRGERELLAVSGDTGQVDWSFSPSSGLLNPLIWIGPQRAVVQMLRTESGYTIGSSTVVLDVATGRRLGEFPQPEGQTLKWERAPLPIDDEHIAIVSDRRTVVLFDLAKGTDSWVFRESEEMPKYGPPRLFGDAERLMLLHDGTELLRLNATTGMKMWSRPLGLENLSERPEALGLDGDRVYWANGASVNALSLRDGSVVWSRSLLGPDLGWSVELTERNLMAYPGPSKKSGEFEGLPVVFCRRATGDLVQRLLFPVAVTDVAVRFAPRGAVIATQSGLWALGERRSVDEKQPQR